MTKLVRYDEFRINERYHVSQDVKHLTNLIYNKIYQLIPNLILKKEIVIENLLQDNYSRIKFKGDRIRIKLGKNHGAVSSIKFVNGEVSDILLELSVKLLDNEFRSKYLINNKIKETINHECQHIIEFYHTGGNVPKSWDFNKRLKKHEGLFINYCNRYKINPEYWLNITHMFYLCEENEIRSNISSTFDYIKNQKVEESNIEDVIVNRKEYKDYKLISVENENTIINNMYRTYSFFNSVLDDFIKSVILNQNSNIRKAFKSEFNRLKKRSSDCCKRMLSVSSNFIEESNRELMDPRLIDRNLKISSILEEYADIDERNIDRGF
jgi:hypothetical protein